MHHHTAACIPFHVVIYQRKTSDTVEVQVLNTEAPTFLVAHLTRTALMRGGKLDAATQQPVACKHPVVGIAARQAEIHVFDIPELQGAVQFHALRTHFLVDDRLQQLMVEIKRVLGIAKAGQPRTATDFLYGALRESCWI